MDAVIALLQGNELGAQGLSHELPILPCQLQCRFDRVRSVGGKQDLVDLFLCRHGANLGRQFDGGWCRGTREGRIIADPVHLCGDGVFHFLAVMADVDVPKATKTIHQAVAVDVRHVTAIGLHDNLGRMFRAGQRMDHRMKLMTSVFLPKEVFVFEHL